MNQSNAACLRLAVLAEYGVVKRKDAQTERLIVSKFIHPYSLQLSAYPKGVRPQYRDYLQAKSFVEDVTESVEKVQYSISESSREMIGTMEQIHERGYELVASAISGVGDQLSEGFETVSWKLDDISGGIDALNAKFDWGFSRMIAGIGRVNDSLQELIAVAKTPAETWAYEQYEIARDAIRRALYPEAVDALLKAINGHGDHVGYKLEFRFHYMLGILYLGDAQNTDPAVLDLAKAEASFLTAARYAKTDYPKETGVALTAAGWAAYCQGKLKEAESHTQQAISIYPQHGEAVYQLAKVQMHTDRPREAIPNLRRSAELDAHYTIRAATDPDFLKYETDVQNLIDALRREAERLASPAINDGKRELSALEEWRAEKAFEPEIKMLDELFARTERNYGANTFLGYLDAKTMADRLSGLGRRLLKEQRQHFGNEVNAGFTRLSEAQSKLKPRAEGLGCWRSSFQTASELLGKVHPGVETHIEYTQKIALLNQAHEALRQSGEECQRQIGERKSGSKLAGTILGAIIGVFAGLIPVAIVVVVLAAIIATILWAISNQDLNAPGSWERFHQPLEKILFLIGMIAACVIGAIAFRKRFLAKHEAFVQTLGVGPSFTGIVGRIKRPAPLFDEHFVKTGKAEVGKTYQGKVVRIETYGAFVEFLPGQSGLVHISELADSHVKRVEDIVRVGDEIYVKHLGTDEKGRVRLSRKQAKSPVVPAPNDLAKALIYPLVTVDEIPLPETIQSGTVRFSNDRLALWKLDKVGRLNVDPAANSPAEMQSFQSSLEAELAKRDC